MLRAADVRLFFMQVKLNDKVELNAYSPEQSKFDLLYEIVGEWKYRWILFHSVVYFLVEVFKHIFSLIW